MVSNYVGLKIILRKINSYTQNRSTIIRLLVSKIFFSSFVPLYLLKVTSISLMLKNTTLPFKKKDGSFLYHFPSIVVGCFEQGSGSVEFDDKKGFEEIRTVGKKREYVSKRGQRNFNQEHVVASLQAPTIVTKKLERF